MMRVRYHYTVRIYETKCDFVMIEHRRYNRNTGSDDQSTDYSQITDLR